MFILCYIADLAHHPIVLLEKPLTEFTYDTDPKQSAESRVKMLTMLAQNRTRLLAYQFAFPGIGHGMSPAMTPETIGFWRFLR